MKLVITHALRLLRKDLARLGDVHRAQFVKSIAPGKPAMAEGFVETNTDDDDSETHGLVYIRFHDAADPSEEIESFLLDDARYPDKLASPSGGRFFRAGTLKSAGVKMSQGGVGSEGPKTAEMARAVSDLVRSCRVAISGAGMKANPPFALVKAP